MESGDHLSERPHRKDTEPALLSHALVKFGLIESAHAERPFDDFSPTANGEKAGGIAGYGHKVKIELRRRPAVDTKLVDAGPMPLLQSRKVEKGVFDGALHLIGEVPYEKHNRGVGLDPLHRLGIGLIGVASR